ncbi:hypothetical protein WICPIJ_001413 [Wickerhamomyces pijperi]|uniref:Uncharacterized protein n=1 Tax=Wickerhamomyces pijperi TaxID=599730 RepID=A0A9P8TPY3_WICPI|nr:hypothetical protein WICPIJ_001413 [Wickerhamomyces pijperi]
MSYTLNFQKFTNNDLLKDWKSTSKKSTDSHCLSQSLASSNLSNSKDRQELNLYCSTNSFKAGTESWNNFSLSFFMKWQTNSMYE